MNLLNLSRSTVIYYKYNQKENHKLRTRNSRAKQHPYKLKIISFKKKKIKKRLDSIPKRKYNKLISKIHTFRCNRRNKIIENTPDFTPEDILNKFGEKPKCYLTGQEIDIYNTKSYHFDHITPVSKGGNNSIDNLGICTRTANLAKSDMTLEEFYKFCETVLDYKNKS